MRSHLDRLLEVSVKTAVTLRNLPIPTLHCVLATAALRFEGGRRWTEREVNNQLLDWLAHEGSMLATDHVELRRVLIDVGLLARDGFGRSYWRPPTGEAFAPIIEELSTKNLPSAIADARTKRDLQRTARARLHGVKV
jgi:hypothetical protein